MRSQPLGCTNDPPVYLLSTEPCRYSFGVRARLPFNRPPGLEDELWPRLTLCCRQGCFVGFAFLLLLLLRTALSVVSVYERRRKERGLSVSKLIKSQHWLLFSRLVAQDLDDSPPYIQHWNNWNRTTCLGCTLGRRVRRVPTLAHLFIRCLRFTLH